MCVLQVLQVEGYTPAPTLILNKCKLPTDVFVSINLVKAQRKLRYSIGIFASLPAVLNRDTSKLILMYFNFVLKSLERMCLLNIVVQ